MLFIFRNVYRVVSSLFFVTITSSAWAAPEIVFKSRIPCVNTVSVPYRQSSIRIHLTDRYLETENGFRFFLKWNGHSFDLKSASGSTKDKRIGEFNFLIREDGIFRVSAAYNYTEGAWREAGLIKAVLRYLARILPDGTPLFLSSINEESSIAVQRVLSLMVTPFRNGKHAPFSNTELTEYFAAHYREYDTLLRGQVFDGSTHRGILWVELLESAGWAVTRLDISTVTEAYNLANTDVALLYPEDFSFHVYAESRRNPDPAVGREKPRPSL